MNLDKRKKAYRKILREYQKFKRKLIYRSEKEVLWESCNKIHFYSSIREYFELNEKIPEVCLDFIMTDSRPIETMWRLYLKKEFLGYQTWQEIDELIDEIIMTWNRPLAG